MAPASLHVAIPFTGILKTRMVPVSKLKITSVSPDVAKDLDNALDIRGTCENLPSGVEGWLVATIKRETAGAASAPAAAKSAKGGKGKGKGKGKAKDESHSLPVKLKFPAGHGKKNFEVTAPDGGKPILNAATHGLWGKGEVNLALKVNMPHAPEAEAPAKSLTFDNPLEVKLTLPANPLIGSGVELTPNMAPCFRGADVTFEAFEKDVTVAGQPKEISDETDYRDPILFPAGRKDPITWRIGIRGRRAHGQLLWGDAAEVGDLEIAYRLLVKAPDAKEERTVIDNVDVTTVPKPRLEKLELQFLGNPPWGHFRVSGRITGLHPDTDLSLEARLYACEDGGKLKDKPEGSASATLADNGDFTVVIGTLGAWQTSDLRKKKVGFLVAVAPSPEHRAKATPFRNLFTCDIGGIRPLQHYFGLGRDPFVTGAICTRCQTFDGEEVKPSLQLFRTEVIQNIMPRATVLDIERLLPALSDAFAEYGLESPLQAAHFLARSAIETAQFSALVERNPPDYTGRLGNKTPEDARRYIGRGLIHLTGHDNYMACGKGLKEQPDLLGHPELLTEPKWAALSAVWFWTARGCREAAEADSIVGVIRKVNPGQKDLTTHWGFLQRAYQAFEFPDVPERIQKNIAEMQREGYTYKGEKKAK
jgi:putative chitinase